MILITIILLIIVSFSLQQQSSLHLHKHSWCPPCKKAQHIFNKVSQNYPQIKFEIHTYSGKTILQRPNASSSPADLLPFPTLVINCSGKSTTYQNDLTIPELTYWIDILCVKKMPNCTNNINQQLFHIAVLPEQDQSQTRRQIQNYPHIKICSAKNAKHSQSAAIQILNKSDQSTLFLDYFNNNVRNYLIKSKKLAVALITNNVNTTKAASFFASYLSLEKFMGPKNASNVSTIFKYKLKDEQKSKLLFLGLCYNSNLTKCVNEPQRQPQVALSQNYIPKLLEFLNLESNQVSEMEYVVAFRFNYPKFESYIYHQALGILDQKFIFWISQLLQNKNKKIDEKRVCLWNSLIHRSSENNLADIQTHNYLATRIDQMKRRFSEEISVTKIVKIFHNDPKFTLCLTGQIPQSFASNKQVQIIIQKLESHFTVKGQLVSNLQL